MDSLTDQQRAILAIEVQFWKSGGGKDEAIRALGLSPIRYYQLLARMLDDEAVLAAQPLLVNRLRSIARR